MSRSGTSRWRWCRVRAPESGPIGGDWFRVSGRCSEILSALVIHLARRADRKRRRRDRRGTSPFLKAGWYGRSSAEFSGGGAPAVRLASASTRAAGWRNQVARPDCRPSSQGGLTTPRSGACALGTAFARHGTPHPPSASPERRSQGGQLIGQPRSCRSVRPRNEVESRQP
jgi:hypothetical protein